MTNFCDITHDEIRCKNALPINKDLGRTEQCIHGDFLSQFCSCDFSIQAEEFVLCTCTKAAKDAFDKALENQLDQDAKDIAEDIKKNFSERTYRAYINLLKTRQ